jgi:DNA-binding transcriptional regulator YiaG
MNQIKELRQRTGLSQAKFGEALGGIPLRTIQDWEGDKRKPSDWAVNLIAFRVENDPQFKR